MSPLPKNRRSLRSTFLEPRVQFHYGVYCFLFAAVAVVLAQFLTYRALRTEVLRILAEAGGDPAGLRGIVAMAMSESLLQSLWLFPVIAAVALFGAAHYLHRFIGPQVPIRRHLGQLRDGDYAATCRIRRKDELHEVVADLNDLARTLEQRHGDGRSADRSRVAGFSLIEVLAVLATISVVSALAVGQFLRAYDRSRQRSTMADMRTVAGAAGTYRVDKGEYAAELASLAPYYLVPVPAVDRWGFAWVYGSTGTAYQLDSRGADGLPGPAAPSPWDGEPYECDLILDSGAFAQAPDI